MDAPIPAEGRIVSARAAGPNVGLHSTHLEAPCAAATRKGPVPVACGMQGKARADLNAAGDACRDYLTDERSRSTA